MTNTASLAIPTPAKPKGLMSVFRTTKDAGPSAQEKLDYLDEEVFSALPARLSALLDNTDDRTGYAPVDLALIRRTANLCAYIGDVCIDDHDLDTATYIYDMIHGSYPDLPQWGTGPKLSILKIRHFHKVLQKALDDRYGARTAKLPYFSGTL